MFSTMYKSSFDNNPLTVKHFFSYFRLAIQKYMKIYTIELQQKEKYRRIIKVRRCLYSE